MNKKRIQRIKELVEYVNSNQHELRYLSLDRFARSHNVSYDTIKKDLALLAYATLPGPEGFNLKYVPRSYRKDVKQVWGIMGIAGGKAAELDHKRAQRAASIFLLHTPMLDVERFMLMGPQTPEIQRMQREFAKSIEQIVEAVKGMRVHPARAYLDAWRIAGVKLHDEIQKALQQAKEGKEAEEVEKVWQANLYKVKAAAEYESFRSDYMNLLQREHKVSSRKTLVGQSLPVSLPRLMEARGVQARTEADADKVWQRLVSDIKNMRRWYWPSRRNPLPKNVKKQVENWFSSLSKEEQRQALRSRDPFIRFMANSAARLSNADRMYAKAKELEETRFLPPRKKRRRR